MGHSEGEHDREQHLRHVEQQLRLREREIEILKTSLSAVNSRMDLNTVLNLVADQARELLNAETVLIPVLDADAEHYTYRAGSGRNIDEVVGETLPLDFGVCGWVWRHKRPWWRGALDELEAVERNRWEADAGTLMLVPMAGRSAFLGGLAAINKISGGDFTAQDLELLSLFAAQASVAIENAMAFADLEKAKRSAEQYQAELRQLNNDLVSINHELEQLALYDTLTQLPNRSLLQDRLQRALYLAERESGQLAVLILDLDEFKTINDTLGHNVGDQLLKQVGDRLSGQLRQTDTLGRLGGDEFALVIPNVTVEQASQLAGSLLASLEADFEIEGRLLPASASIGIAAYPSHGLDASTLMKHADIAMYTAKRTRFGYSVYADDQELPEPDSLNLLGDLRQALTAREIVFYYQPKIDLRSGALHGVEALARWPHPTRGMIPPDKFIPMLEQTGLIRQFTQWAIERGLQQCAEWHAAGMNLSLAVNVSIHSLLDPHFPAQVMTLLKKYPAAQNNLVMEITESAFLGEHIMVGTVLNQLCEQGIRFSIDDFGTGHSSLSRLKKLPVSELKIDRSFVKDMETDRDDGIIVRSTVDLAHNLGLAVIAEGVEDKPTLRALSEMGCDMAQGYYISRPMPVAEFNRRLHNQTWTLLATR